MLEKPISNEFVDLLLMEQIWQWNLLKGFLSSVRP